MDPYDYDEEYPSQQKKGFLKSNMKAVVGVAACIVILLVVILAIVIGIELTRNDDSDTNPDGENPQTNPEEENPPDDGDDTVFWKRMSLEGLQETLKKLQEIADENGGTRAIESTGYNASIEYIRSQLEGNPELSLSVQPFSMSLTIPLGEPSLTSETASEELVSYVFGTDFDPMPNSGAGEATGLLYVVPEFGCYEEDFADFPPKSIALVSRGNCTFVEKVSFAEAAGAVGVLMYNNEAGLFIGSLGPEPRSIPVFALSAEAGNKFSSLPEGTTVDMIYPAEIQTIYTSNLIAETKSGNPDSVIVVGSHLDSVIAGPGINDNGSGSSANLEMAKNFKPENLEFVNRVRFIWYGAEERGLVGSTFYVNSLDATEKAKIALNLNFDMLGSPNFQRGILNGTSADDPIRHGSTLIMESFIEFFDSQNLTWELLEFTGRSDYGPYLEAGIPAGGIETGAEKIKDMEGRTLFGGMANVPYDPCYHQPCDTYENINFDVLLEMTQAAAYSLEYFALQEDLKTLLNVTPPAA